MNSLMGRALLGLALGGVLLLTSCSSKEKTIPVSGTVTWEGQKIPDGDILLYPENMKSANPDPGRIIDGIYRVEVKQPGKKVVHIFYSREKPVPAGVMGQKEREQLIPKEYNHESRLRVEVTEG